MSTQNQSALSVSNIHKAFGSTQVLKGISLDAHKGDVISILGASGSGKSTFCVASICWRHRMRGALSLMAKP